MRLRQLLLHRGDHFVALGVGSGLAGVIARQTLIIQQVGIALLLLILERNHLNKHVFAQLIPVETLKLPQIEHLRHLGDHFLQPRGGNGTGF